MGRPKKKTDEEVDFSDKGKFKDDAPAAGHNIAEINKRVKLACKNILQYRKDRDEVNASINEEYAAVKALGIPKAILTAAINRSEMDPDKRDELDTSFQIACEALGVPFNAEQMEMFEEDAPTKTLTGKEAAAEQSSSRVN